MQHLPDEIEVSGASSIDRASYKAVNKQGIITETQCLPQVKI